MGKARRHALAAAFAPPSSWVAESSPPTMGWRGGAHQPSEHVCFLDRPLPLSAVLTFGCEVWFVFWHYFCRFEPTPLPLFLSVQTCLPRAGRGCLPFVAAFAPLRRGWLCDHPPRWASVRANGRVAPRVPCPGMALYALLALLAFPTFCWLAGSLTPQSQPEPYDGRGQAACPRCRLCPPSSWVAESSPPTMGWRGGAHQPFSCIAGARCQFRFDTSKVSI